MGGGENAPCCSLFLLDRIGVTDNSSKNPKPGDEKDEIPFWELAFSLFASLFLLGELLRGSETHQVLEWKQQLFLGKHQLGCSQKKALAMVRRKLQQELPLWSFKSYPVTQGLIIVHCLVRDM